MFGARWSSPATNAGPFVRSPGYVRPRGAPAYLIVVSSSLAAPPPLAPSLRLAAKDEQPNKRQALFDANRCCTWSVVVFSKLKITGCALCTVVCDVAAAPNGTPNESMISYFGRLFARAKFVCHRAYQLGPKRRPSADRYLHETTRVWPNSVPFGNKRWAGLLTCLFYLVPF